MGTAQARRPQRGIEQFFGLGSHGAVAATVQMVLDRSPFRRVDLVAALAREREQRANVLAIHHGPSLGSAARLGATCSNRCRKKLLALASRDITVPRGTFICSAISR